MLGERDAVGAPTSTRELRRRPRPFLQPTAALEELLIRTHHTLGGSSLSSPPNLRGRTLKESTEMPQCLFERGPLDGHTEEGEMHEFCAVSREQCYLQEGLWPIPLRSCDRDTFGWGEWRYAFCGTRTVDGENTLIYRFDDPNYV